MLHTGLNSTIKSTSILLTASLFLLISSVSFAARSTDSANIDLDIDIENEDKEVGLKRLELLEKILTTDLMDKKQAHVASIEANYDEKITTLLKGLISPVIVPKVATNIDVNFFSAKFESQVKSKQSMAVSIIINESAFENFKQQNGGKRSALKSLKTIISTTYKIPKDNISIVVIGSYE